MVSDGRNGLINCSVNDIGKPAWWEIMPWATPAANPIKPGIIKDFRLSINSLGMLELSSSCPAPHPHSVALLTACKNRHRLCTLFIHYSHMVSAFLRLVEWPLTAKRLLTAPIQKLLGSQHRREEYLEILIS